MNLEKIRLTLAEDHPDLRSAVVNMIRKWSNHIDLLRAVSNGIELVDSIRIARPDVVITDIQMPYMYGITACRKINELFKEVKVIFFSVLEEQSFYNEAIEAGAAGHMPKNIGKEAFFETVQRVQNGELCFTLSNCGK